MLELNEYGWSDSVARRFSPLLESDTFPGRVVRGDRGRYLAATGDGIVPCAAATEFIGGGVAVGDWVAIRGQPRAGRMIVGVAERTSAIVRRDPSPGDNRDQVLAANLDSAFILCRLDRKVRMSVIERYMVLVWDSGSVPVIVLSKADLVPEADVASALRMVTRDAAGVTVVATSGVTGEGVGDLAPFLAEAQTVGLLGESGAGKSTLINQLVGSAVLETGETRRGDGRGRHTTTARQMLPLGNGTVVIDTPGLRTVGLADSSDGISRVFADVEELAGYCKFRDCSHQAEPGCAILMAIEGGVLDARRFESYLKLEREQARLVQRKEAIIRRAVRKEVARKRIKSAQRSREL